MFQHQPRGGEILNLSGYVKWAFDSVGAIDIGAKLDKDRNVTLPVPGS